MKIKTFLFLASLMSVCSGAAYTQGLQPSTSSPDTNPYLDSAYHDYVETAYGYRNPRHTPRFVRDFRDSLAPLNTATLKTALPAAVKKPLESVNRAPANPASVVSAAQKPAPGQYYKVTFARESGPLSAYVNPLDPNALSGFKAGDYAFITVLPGTNDYPALVRALSEHGFKFVGEKTYFTGSGKKTYLLGWAPYSKLAGIYKHPSVRRVTIEKKSAGVPFKTAIRFVLRAPGGDRASAFVSDFIRKLSATSGFSAEKVFRLPKNSGNAKFTAFEITGTMPVDMVGDISRSPFVAAVEFKDKSL